MQVCMVGSGEEGEEMNILTLFFVGLIILLVVAFVFEPQLNDITGIKSPSDHCSDDCEKFNHTYFKWKSGGFGPSECWCEVENGTERIW